MISRNCQEILGPPQRGQALGSVYLTELNPQSVWRRERAQANRKHLRSWPKIARSKRVKKARRVRKVPSEFSTDFSSYFSADFSFIRLFGRLLSSGCFHQTHRTRRLLPGSLASASRLQIKVINFSSSRSQNSMTPTADRTVIFQVPAAPTL